MDSELQSSDNEEDFEETLERLQRECQYDSNEIPPVDKPYRPSYSYGCARTSGVAVCSKPLPKNQKSKAILKIKVAPCVPIQKHSSRAAPPRLKNTCASNGEQSVSIKKEPVKIPDTSTQKKSAQKSTKVSTKKLVRKKTANGMRESYSCGECGEVFRFKSNLRRHEERHFASPYDHKCDQCGKTFSVRRNLTRHLKLHVPVDPDDRPYACNQCDKTFHRAKTLYQHKITHSNVRPHACQFCVKTFKTVFNLQCHEAIHLNCKPYVCQFCGMAFIRSSYRTIHERIHTNERPYKCDVCDKSFTRGDHLKSHKKVHRKINKMNNTAVLDQN